MFNLCISGKMFASKVFFQWTKQVKVTWGEIGAGGWMIKKFLLEFQIVS
jgi:hypothetical protein